MLNPPSCIDVTAYVTNRAVAFCRGIHFLFIIFFPFCHGLSCFFYYYYGSINTNENDNCIWVYIFMLGIRREDNIWKNIDKKDEEGSLPLLSPLSTSYHHGVSCSLSQSISGFMQTVLLLAFPRYWHVVCRLIYTNIVLRVKAERRKSISGNCCLEDSVFFIFLCLSVYLCLY